MAAGQFDPDLIVLDLALPGPKVGTPKAPLQAVASLLGGRTA